MTHQRIARLTPGCFALFVLEMLAPPGATGQQIPPDTARLTLTGVIYEQGRGTPIPGARIRFSGTDFQATTGDDGRYTIEGLRTGAYQVELDALGYRSIRGGIRMMHAGELSFPMEPLAGPARAGQRSRIVGRVVEMDGGAPLKGAEVTLAGRSSSQISDGDGRFEIGGLTPGTWSLSVRYLGRAPLQAELEVPPEGTLDVEIRLAVEPVELEPMVVTATPRSSYLEDMGFYRRREQGLSGTQVTRQTLLEMNPRSLGDVLVTVPGLRVIPSNLADFQVRMRRSVRLTVDAGEGCTPALFVDDIRSQIGWLQDLDPARVEALEIYSGANAPLRYNDPCGVILVWTRRGERGRGRG